MVTIVTSVKTKKNPTTESSCSYHQITYKHVPIPNLVFHVPVFGNLLLIPLVLWTEMEFGEKDDTAADVGQITQIVFCNYTLC